METNRESFLKRLFGGDSMFGPSVVMLLAFLLPLFIIPFQSFPFQFSKTLLALVGVVVLLLLFGVRSIQTNSVSFPWPLFSWAFVIVPFGYAIASFFSGTPTLSFFGYQLDSDTCAFILLASALTLLISATLTARSVFSTLVALLAAGWVAILFQAAQLFFGAPLELPALASTVANLLGKWNDLALFMGLIASLALIALETLFVSRPQRFVLLLTLIGSVALLIVINFFLAWALLGAMAFLLAVLAFSGRMRARGEQPKYVGITPLAVLLVATFFMFFGAPTSISLQSALGVQALEVRPSFEGTLTVLKAVYEESPVFGMGPNTFSEEWFLHRPAAIITTPFWNVNFSAGFATVPTAFASGGLVLGFSWLILFALFLYTALRALLTASSSDARSYVLIAATGAGSLYLLLAHLFYVPSVSVTLILFLLMGLFIVSLRGTSAAKEIVISFPENPRFGFVSVVVIAAFVLISLVSLYGAGRLYASTVYHNRAVAESVEGDIAGALADVGRALTYSEKDRYYRTLTALELARLQAIVARGVSDSAAQETFRGALTEAINASARAVAINRNSYDNWIARSSVYAAVVPLGIEGAYENAVAMLEEARIRNPGSPEVDLRLAELHIAIGDGARARESAEAAVAAKPDYTPAILLLAQLSLNEGKLTEAISSVESAVYFDPGNQLLLYQLGLLYLQGKEYKKAADAFTQALVRDPNYANASFYLAATNVFLGNEDDALTRLKELQLKNPDNTVLKESIAAIERGTNPFDNGTPLPPGEKASEE